MAENSEKQELLTEEQPDQLQELTRKGAELQGQLSGFATSVKLGRDGRMPETPPACVTNKMENKGSNDPKNEKGTDDAKTEDFMNYEYKIGQRVRIQGHPDTMVSNKKNSFNSCVR